MVYQSSENWHSEFFFKSSPLSFLSSDKNKERSFNSEVSLEASFHENSYHFFFLLRSWVIVSFKRICHDLLITIFLNMISVNYKKAIMFESIQETQEMLH